MNINTPLVLAPVYKDYFWGGDRLKTDFHKETEVSPLAESWELACHAKGCNTILTAPYTGMTLRDLILQNGNAFLGSYCKNCEAVPIMVKLIDAKEGTSVQVHPNDSFGMKAAGQPGKAELWYILEAEPDAYIYHGLRYAITQEWMYMSIQDKSLLNIMNKIYVHPGDAYYVPAGSLHAVGPGVVLAEISQNSDVEFRVYDYHRKNEEGQYRPLQMDTAIAAAYCTTLNATPQNLPQRIEGGQTRLLWTCSWFQANLYTVETAIALSVDSTSFQHILVVDGQGTLHAQGETVPLQKGSSVLLPAELGDISVEGRCQCIRSKVAKPLNGPQYHFA